MVKINIDPILLNKVLSKAFKKTCENLVEKMTEIIEREGGYSPPFPAGRDIVDTGALKESQSIEYLTPTHARITYDVDYAMDVHEGCTLNSGKRMAGRPWTWDAVDELDVVNDFSEQLSSI